MFENVQVDVDIRTGNPLRRKKDCTAIVTVEYRAFSSWSLLGTRHAGTQKGTSREVFLGAICTRAREPEKAGASNDD